MNDDRERWSDPIYDSFLGIGPMPDTLEEQFMVLFFLGCLAACTAVGFGIFYGIQWVLS